jgi:hypothetical protein
MKIFVRFWDVLSDDFLIWSCDTLGLIWACVLDVIATIWEFSTSNICVSPFFPWDTGQKVLWVLNRRRPSIRPSKGLRSFFAFSKCYSMQLWNLIKKASLFHSQRIIMWQLVALLRSPALNLLNWFADVKQSWFQNRCVAILRDFVKWDVFSLLSARSFAFDLAIPSVFMAPISLPWFVPFAHFSKYGSPGIDRPLEIPSSAIGWIE